jgi:hypothetical protein
MAAAAVVEFGVGFIGCVLKWERTVATLESIMIGLGYFLDTFG